MPLVGGPELPNFGARAASRGTSIFPPLQDGRKNRHEISCVDFAPTPRRKQLGGYVEQCLLHRPMTSKPEESFRDHTIWSALSMSGSNQHFMRINLRRMELSAV